MNEIDTNTPKTLIIDENFNPVLDKESYKISLD